MEHFSPSDLRPQLEAREALEQQLFDQAYAAVRSGQLEQAQMLMDALRSIRALLQSEKRAPQVEESRSLASVEASSARRPKADRRDGVAEVAGNYADQKHGGHPFFRRNGQELVKIGWSKSANGEYVHRAPRRSVDAIVSAVERLGTKRFQIKDLIGNLSPSDGEQPLGYQVYNVIAWLRAANLIESHGRDGYKSARRDLVQAASAAWDRLERTTR